MISGMSMTLDEYQDWAMSTRLGTAGGVYALLGISGEVGELHSHIAKAIRDGKEFDSEYIQKELGDILWFIAAIAQDFNLSLHDVALANIEKLQARQKKGTLQGSGDER